MSYFNRNACSSDGLQLNLGFADFNGAELGTQTIYIDVVPEILDGWEFTLLCGLNLCFHLKLARPSLGN